MCRRSLPPSARYIAGTGQGFTLDVTGARPLLRFDRSTEIWVLRPTPAPRGDIIYRNDNGDQVLRVTADGGLTLYTTTAPQGSPVSQAGAERAVRAVYAAAPFRGLPREFYGDRIAVNFNAREACAR